MRKRFRLFDTIIIILDQFIILKTHSRTIFNDITNKHQQKLNFSSSVKEILKNNVKPQKILNHNVYLEDTFHFEGNEIRNRLSTKTFKTLNYINKNNRAYRFYCFNDSELRFPTVHKNNTIQHNIDNDCSTDDNQIKGAIIKLYKNLDQGVKDDKERKLRDMRFYD